MSQAKLEQAVACAALERAHAAARRGDDSAELDALLEAWAAVRDRDLADRIDMASHRAARARPEVTDETQWFSRTEDADAVELGRLLAKLPRRASLTVPGLEALLDRRPDPRLASVSMRVRVSLRGRFPSSPAARLAMLRHLDPVYLSTFRALREQTVEPNPELDATIADHEALIRVRATRLDAAGQAWLAALDQLGRAPNDAGTPAGGDPAALSQELAVSLLAQIAAHPRERDHRQVYADLLQQRGDVHGEFIALQLRAEQGSLGPAGHERIAALLDAHARTWLGNFAEVLDLEQLEFRAGFAVRGVLVGLDGARVISPREAQWLETHPGLATFEHLDGAPASLDAALGLD